MADQQRRRGDSKSLILTERRDLKDEDHLPFGNFGHFQAVAIELGVQEQDLMEEKRLR